MRRWKTTSVREKEFTKNCNEFQPSTMNVKNQGLCFEKRVFDDKVQIPLDVIKKLGFFDIHRRESKVCLDIVLLSFMEFCCAGSLCREGVNIEEELSKIKELDRYEAVTTYMAPRTHQ